MGFANKSRSPKAWQAPPAPTGTLLAASSVGICETLPSSRTTWTLLTIHVLPFCADVENRRCALFKDVIPADTPLPGQVCIGVDSDCEVPLLQLSRARLLAGCVLLEAASRNKKTREHCEPQASQPSKVWT